MIDDTGGFLSALGRELAAGFELATFRRVRTSKARPGCLVALILLLGTAAVHAGFSYARQVGTVYFYDMAAGYLAASLLFVVLLSMGVTWRQGVPERTVALLTLVAAGFLWITTTLNLAWTLVEPHAYRGWFFLVSLAWSIAVVLRAMVVTAGPLPRRVRIVVAVVAAAIPLAGAYRGASAELFYAYDDEWDAEWEEYADIDVESAFYAQAELLAEKLGTVAANDPDATDFYFLGFAGDGDEEVFASEARYAENALAEVFDTSGRSLTLVNDLDAITTEPLANTHNLFLAIERIAGNMDLADDVLITFLTSHGSEDASIAVELYPFDLKDLTAEDLRAALDEVGIEWRIVIVSACYSGSFIEPLRNERTLIITASAFDRNSFGCSSERELTYFGEAFFRDSLPASGDLVVAFETAQANIANRERREGHDSSNPQIFIGSEIEIKLTQAGFLVPHQAAPNPNRAARPPGSGPVVPD